MKLLKEIRWGQTSKAVSMDTDEQDMCRLIGLKETLAMSRIHPTQVNNTGVYGHPQAGRLLAIRTFQQGL